MKYYWAYMIFISSLMTLALIHFFSLEQQLGTIEEDEKNDETKTELLRKIGTVSSIFNYSIAFIFILLVLFGLCRPGTSKDLRLKVCKRYISYLFVFLAWVVCLTISFYGKFPVILMITSGLLGIPLALARLFEPLVWQEFK